MREITSAQARRYLTLLHFENDSRKRADKTDTVIAHAQALGCVQYDPLNVAGRNADLVMQSRVAGYKPEMLHKALYKRRALMEGYDKNLAIFPVSDFPALARTRRDTLKWFRGNDEIRGALFEVLRQITDRGELCSDDLDMDGKVRWAWSDTRLGRAALETLWTEGRLSLSRRDGARRYFDLVERCVPADIAHAPDPNPEDADYYKWQFLRRTRSVGMLTSGSSDALLGIDGMKAAERGAAIASLVEESRLEPVNITDAKLTVYVAREDLEMLDLAEKRAPKNVCRLLAPLDNMIWDRKLIEKLFDFRYRWEVYTPVAKREFGYYVLPLMRGAEFIGRIEPVPYRGGRLTIKHIWWEDGQKPEKHAKALAKCLDTFCRYLGAEGWDMADTDTAKY